MWCYIHTYECQKEGVLQFPVPKAMQITLQLVTVKSEIGSERVKTGHHQFHPTSK